MKNCLFLSFLSILFFSCQSKKAIILVENKPNEIEVKPIIEKDTIIDIEDDSYPQFEIDSQHIILQQFETYTVPNIYYEKTNKIPSIDTIIWTGKYLNLGKIVHHRKVVISIPFTNTGKYPLVIRYCKSSWGGMIAHAQKEPIFPNETGFINVQFYSRKMIGGSRKTITISTNTKEDRYRLALQWEFVAEE